MKYVFAPLIPLVALSQVIDPNAKPKPGFKFEMKHRPLVSGEVVIEEEPGDSVVVQPDGSIVATSRSKSLIFPLNNRMEPKVHSSYRSVNSRVQYEYVISNGAGAVNAIETFVFAISSPSDITAAEPWRFIRVNKPNEQPSIGFFRFVHDGDGRKKLSAGVTLDPIRLMSDYVPGLIETTFHSDPTEQPQWLTAGAFFNSASPWVQQQLGKVDTQDRRLLRGLTIGPVAPLNTDSLEGIRLEVQSAAQRSQFALLRELMLNRPIPTELKALSTWLSDVGKLSADGIEPDFADAMIWRLGRLR